MLAEQPAPGVADVPFETQFPLAGDPGLAAVLHVFVTLGFFLILAVFRDLSYDPRVWLLVGVGFSLSLFTSGVTLFRLTRSLRLSDEGILIGRLRGSVLVRWWELRRVEAKHDLSRIAFARETGTVSLRPASLKPDQLRQLVALRARLLAQRQDIEPLTGRDLDAAGPHNP